MDVTINFYGREACAPPLAVVDKSFSTMLEANKWAQHNYMAYKARRFVIIDKHDPTLVEQWDELDVIPAFGLSQDVK